MQRLLFSSILLFLFPLALVAQEERKVKDHYRVLLLGDRDHHQPTNRFRQFEPVLEASGVRWTYAETVDDLNPDRLAGYDCIAIYANYTRISDDQEKALLEFVNAGGGLVAIHCASFCFLNSTNYLHLVGARFKSHQTGEFAETILKPEHPVLHGVEPIRSWDETYVHEKHNPDRIVLSERVEGDHHEPYTWVRTSGKGRVFYTAWGHDQRTWGNTNFQRLLLNAIRWTSEASPHRLEPNSQAPGFHYTNAPAALPNYLAGAKWGTQGKPIETMQEPLSPQESIKHLSLLPGFEAKLFAAEPEVIKPICLQWDTRGRLWIAETVDYPNQMQPMGQGHDRLKICEDTDGDGRADKFTIAADGLSIPSGFVFYRDGVIVVHSGLTEFLQDTDHDGKMDKRTVLFRGWGTEDTHAGPSNLRYGFDNWIWGTVGYSGFEGEVGGKKIRFSQGIFRFKPDGSALEFVRSSNNNTWGLGLSEDNLIFGSTANGNASMYMPIPNRYYEAVQGWSASRLESIADAQDIFPITDKVRQVDWHGRYTAGAGSAIYTARHFPEEFWNSAQFVAEPTGHLLGMFRLHRSGADFTAYNCRSFLASDDEWTSPVAAEVGPDGALWVIDWYNYIIQHNPTPIGHQKGKGNAYETAMRDKTHGRIYRVYYPSRPFSHPENLENADTPSLVRALRNDNLFWRMTAQRLLVEKADGAAAAALINMIGENHRGSAAANYATVHALWALSALPDSNRGDNASYVFAAALKHPSAAVRRAALMTMPRKSRLRLPYAEMMDSSDALVRLAALLAESDMPPQVLTGQKLVRLLTTRDVVWDRWLTDAATCAAARNDLSFLEAALDESKGAASLTRGARLSASAPWKTVTYSGQANFQRGSNLADEEMAISSTNGADASWSLVLPVRSGVRYELSGSIKTTGVAPAGGQCLGALLNIHELGDPKNGVTPAVTGTRDWTDVLMRFDSGNMTQVTVNCLLGGWGKAQGTAAFRNIQLRQLSEPNAPLQGVVERVATHYAMQGPSNVVMLLDHFRLDNRELGDLMLQRFAESWPASQPPQLNETQCQKLKGLLTILDENGQTSLVTLAQKWGRMDLFPEVLARLTKHLQEGVSNPGFDAKSREKAASELLALNDSPESVEFILNQITPQMPPESSRALINTLAEARSAQAGAVMVKHIPQLTPFARRLQINLLLRRQPWCVALLDGVQKGNLSVSDLSAEQWSQLKTHSDPEIVRRSRELAGSAGTVSADRVEIVKKLLPLASRTGDAGRGKEVFTANCVVCHALNGQGGKVGPDLGGIGARDRKEILTDILDPNRSVEANFRLWNVTTTGDETFSGRLETETQTTVEILDAASQKHVIQRKDITKMETSGLSIMPAGFEAIPEADLAALLTFLTTPQTARN